jgi:prephenate dehydratase
MKKIAFQGENGAFSELAAIRYFSGKIQPVAFGEFEDVFTAVKQGRVHYGIIPIENSLSGSIHQNYDLLLKYPLWIFGEIKLRISHNLIVNPRTSFNDIMKVYSHPQALAQCQSFLKSLKGAVQIPASDTAGAVKYIRDTQAFDSAAVASNQAALDYRMKVLKRDIEDNEKNFTRFVLLSKKPMAAKGVCKTSVVFALKNIPGALYKSLSVFAIRDIDLLKIESRPIPGSPWKYIFYLDFAGKMNSPVALKAVEHLKEITQYLKVLGSYPQGKEKY